MTATFMPPKVGLETVEYQKFSPRLSRNVRKLRTIADEILPLCREILNYIFPNEISCIPSEALLHWFFWLNETEFELSVDHPTGFAVSELKKQLKVGLFESSVLHFSEQNYHYLTHYDLFLKHFSPQIRKRTGTYYTPMPSAEYMVRTAIDLLETEFGLRPQEVLWVDFACGTGLFPYLIGRATNFDSATEVIGLEKEYAPMGLASYHFRNYPGFRFILSNPLEEIPEELLSRLEKKPVVLIGNPPWSGISENKQNFITNLIEDYKYINKIPLGEKKYWLQDDYVKFIRLSEHLINKCSTGLISIISNHNFLDNPTFRGMRHHLLNSFNQIKITDLKGNLKKNILDRHSDQNIFGVETGASIFFGLKNASKKGISYHSLSGSITDKYEQLSKLQLDIGTEIHPVSPHYFFIPQLVRPNAKIYENFIPIRSLFRTSNTGVISARDKFLTDFEVAPLLERLKTAAHPEFSDEYIAKLFNLKNTSSFNLTKARTSLYELTEDEIKKFIIPFAYRPFDVRMLFYHPDWVERRVFSTCGHLLRPNLAIIFQRGCSSHHTMNLPQATRFVADHGLSYPANRAVSYVAPLFFYENEEALPNLRPDLCEVRSERLGFNLEPESFFNYIFAVLHSNRYRNQFAQELTADFPKIPLPENETQFLNLAKTGKKLFMLHLGELSEKECPELQVNCPFPLIKKVFFRDGKVYLNNNCYISGISEEEFSYYIGGYESVKRYFNGQKNRILTSEILIPVRKLLYLIRSLPELIREADSQIHF